MKVLQLTPLAKARVWFHGAIPGFVSNGSIKRQIDENPTISVARTHVTLEALVPRGGYAQYGLLGIDFEQDGRKGVEVEVHYSDAREDRWVESLGKQLDDVWLGLPLEYAGPTLDATVDFATHRFPSGTIKVVEAAHGLVGSSPDFFRRLAAGALALMLDGRQPEDNDTITFLRGLLVG